MQDLNNLLTLFNTMRLIDNKFLFLRNCFCFMIEQFCLPKLNICFICRGNKDFLVRKGLKYVSIEKKK